MLLASALLLLSAASSEGFSARAQCRTSMAMSASAVDLALTPVLQKYVDSLRSTTGMTVVLWVFTVYIEWN